MSNGMYALPLPTNEPIRSYAPGSPEREAVQEQLDVVLGEAIEIPLVIGGEEVTTGDTGSQVCPHDHGHVLATYHKAGEAEVERAVRAAADAWQDWSEAAWEERASVILKAAELLAGPWRYRLNAATMLNQSKTVFQAEIDSACELIDFWRFNPSYARELYLEQPISPGPQWNYVDYRPLEGFVFAVTPFNFTSIAGNLPTSPVLMGNTVLWKPASTAVVSGYYIMKLLQEAGLPDGVINFIPGSGGKVGNPVMAQPRLAGVHFTGSTDVFQSMWRTIGTNIAHYNTYPRIVGETGGKDFVFAHASADIEALATALVRGAFEYQGQKCSAASRAYIPRSIWGAVRDGAADLMASITMGSPLDFTNFMAAMIDEPAFDTAMAYLEHAKQGNGHTIIAGGSGDKSEGYFLQPTLVESSDPRSKLMSEEIFAPILTVYVYDDSDLDGALELCDTTSPYSLTGGVFGQDRYAIAKIAKRLRHASGNFYINDKPTGAVVGQQPFGGSRASGTNDKAGSKYNLVRWVSQRSTKENFLPPTDYRYPHMG